MATPPLSLEAFEALVLNAASDDNAVRRQAEAELDRHLSVPVVGGPMLVHLMRVSESPVVRCLCAILLRRAVSDNADFYLKLPVPVQTQIKASLLEALPLEQQSKVRHMMRAVIAEIAACSWETEAEWSELLQSLFEWVQGENPLLREDALAVFSTLAIELDRLLHPFVPHLVPIFVASLADGKHRNVQLEALKATVTFMMTLEEEALGPFNLLLPHMMQVLSAALGEDDSENGEKAMQIFVDLVESNALFLRPQLDGIVEAMVQIALNDGMSEEIQQLALEFLVTLAEKAPSLARRKRDFIEKVFPIALKYMVRIEDDPPLEVWATMEDAEKDDSLEAALLGDETIDRLAHALGGKNFVTVAFTFISQFLQNPDWKYRHAALMATAFVGEGCFKVLEPDIGSVVDVVLQLFRDPHPRVRYAACHSIGQMATDFVPTLQSTQHAKVIPALVHVIADANVPRLQSHGCAAVSNFCEDCRQEFIEPYLNELLGTVLGALQSGNRMVQEQGITAVASIADCAGKLFIPFYGTFMPLLKSVLVRATGKEHRLLRSKSMETISLIGVAVGKERFVEDAKEVMDVLVRQQAQPMEADDPQVHYMLSAWGRICTCLGDAFIPYLPVVMPPLLEMARREPDQVLLDENDDESVLEAEGYEFASYAGRKLGVTTSVIEEKANAVHLLSCYIYHLKAGFEPYLEEATRIMVPLLHYYFDEDTRISAANSLTDIMAALRGAVESRAQGGVKPDYLPLQNVFLFIVNEFLGSLGKEFSLDVLNNGLVIFRLCLEDSEGLSLEPQHLPELAQLVLKLLSRSNKRKEKRLRLASAHDVDREELAVMEEENAKEDTCVSHLGDLVGAALKHLGPGFLQVFVAALQAPFAAMLEVSQPAVHRLSALCVFCDLFESLGAGVEGGPTPQQQQQLMAPEWVALAKNVLPFTLQYCGDADGEVLLAATYAVGPIAIAAAVKDHVPEILQTLLQVCQAQTEDTREIAENSLSSMLKLSEAYPDFSPQVLPIFLAHLPFHKDKAEARMVHDKFLKLIESNNEALFGVGNANIPRIIDVLRKLHGSDLVHEHALPLVQRMLEVFGAPLATGAGPALGDEAVR